MNIFTITKSGELKRVDNSLVFILENKQKIKIPINKIEQIEIYSNVILSSELLYFLNKNKIGINFYHHFTNEHFGEYNMWNKKGSEKLLFKQIETYKNKEYFISKIYNGIIDNLIFLLKKYQKRSDIGKDITIIIKKLRIIKKQNLPIDFLLFEAKIWQTFYLAIDLIIIKEFSFIKRTKRPPENHFNSLISFVNMKLYFLINNIIKSTKLDNRIGYIHSLTDNSRFSLALDISELFKPIFTFFFIFNIVNNKKITKKDFEKDNFNLNNDGLKKINILFNEMINKTIFYKKYNRYVSFKQLIKIECFKLIKNIYDNIEYIPINFEKLENENNSNI